MVLCTLVVFRSMVLTIQESMVDCMQVLATPHPTSQGEFMNISCPKKVVSLRPGVWADNDTRMPCEGSGTARTKRIGRKDSLLRGWRNSSSVLCVPGELPGHAASRRRVADPTAQMLVGTGVLREGCSPNRTCWRFECARRVVARKWGPPFLTSNGFQARCNSGPARLGLVDGATTHHQGQSCIGTTGGIDHSASPGPKAARGDRRHGAGMT